MERLICAGWLWDGMSAEMKRNFGICIKDGLVNDAGPCALLRKRHPGSEVQDRPGWMLLPGFIDAHDHGRGLSPLRFGAEDSALETWIPRLGSASLPPYEAALYDGTLLATGGVTTVVHCHNTIDVNRLEEELAETVRGYCDAGIRVALCPPYTDQNSLIYTHRDEFERTLPAGLREEFRRMICDRPMELSEYFDLIDRLRMRFAPQIKERMVDIQLSPVGGQWCSDQALLKIRDFAQDRKMKVHMHLLETKYQMYYAEDLWGKSMVEHFDEIGFLGPWLTCAHAVWLTERDRELLGRSGVTLVNNPSSNLRLQSGSMSLRDALDQRIVCALGLDGCAYDDDQDYVRELRTALFNNRRTGVAGGITCEEVLGMALEGGYAATAGRLSPGRIAVGEPADIVCFDRERLVFPYADSSIDGRKLIVRLGRRSAVAQIYCGGNPILEQENDTEGLLRSAGERLAETIRSMPDGKTTAPSEEILRKIHDFYAVWEERS